MSSRPAVSHQSSSPSSQARFSAGVGKVRIIDRDFIEYHNLQRQILFDEEDINPIVLNGLKTDTKNHDFFSVKGNGYVKAVTVEKLTDEDFIFEF